MRELPRISPYTHFSPIEEESNIETTSVDDNDFSHRYFAGLNHDGATPEDDFHFSNIASSPDELNPLPPVTPPPSHYSHELINALIMTLPDRIQNNRITWATFNIHEKRFTKGHSFSNTDGLEQFTYPPTLWLCHQSSQPTPIDITTTGSKETHVVFGGVASENIVFNETDLFQQIKVYMENLNDVNKPLIKTVFALHQGFHWKTLFLNICRTNNTYSLQIEIHDPYFLTPQEQLPPHHGLHQENRHYRSQDLDSSCDTLYKKIKLDAEKIFGQNTLIRCANTFIRKRQQQRSDTIHCGVYFVDMIENLLSPTAFDQRQSIEMIRSKQKSSLASCITNETVKARLLDLFEYNQTDAVEQTTVILSRHINISQALLAPELLPILQDIEQYWQQSQAEGDTRVFLENISALLHSRSQHEAVNNLYNAIRHHDGRWKEEWFALIKCAIEQYRSHLTNIADNILRIIRPNPAYSCILAAIILRSVYTNTNIDIEKLKNNILNSELSKNIDFMDCLFQQTDTGTDFLFNASITEEIIHAILPQFPNALQRHLLIEAIITRDEQHSFSNIRELCQWHNARQDRPYPHSNQTLPETLALAQQLQLKEWPAELRQSVLIMTLYINQPTSDEFIADLADKTNELTELKENETKILIHQTAYDCSRSRRFMLLLHDFRQFHHQDSVSSQQLIELLQRFLPKQNIPLKSIITQQTIPSFMTTIQSTIEHAIQHNITPLSIKPHPFTSTSPCQEKKIIKNTTLKWFIQQTVANEPLNMIDINFRYPILKLRKYNSLKLGYQPMFNDSLTQLKFTDHAINNLADTQCVARGQSAFFYTQHNRVNASTYILAYFYFCLHSFEHHHTLRYTQPNTRMPTSITQLKKVRDIIDRIDNPETYLAEYISLALEGPDADSICQHLFSFNLFYLTLPLDLIKEVCETIDAIITNRKITHLSKCNSLSPCSSALVHALITLNNNIHQQFQQTPIKLQDNKYVSAAYLLGIGEISKKSDQITSPVCDQGISLTKEEIKTSIKVAKIKTRFLTNESLLKPPKKEHSKPKLDTQHSQRKKLKTSHNFCYE